MREISRTPWFNLKGYLACTVRFEDGSKKTVLQHREVMERMLGRPLLSREIVHHKDENKRNNEPNNLEITSKPEHGTHHAVRSRITLVCKECDKSFERRSSEERHFRRQSKTGPFCGKSCAGKWSRRQQLDASVAQRQEAPGLGSGQ